MKGTQYTRKGALIGLISLAILMVTPLTGAIFLKLEGVEGESQDKVHQGEIDVLAWSWGMSNTVDRTGRGGTGKVAVSDLTLIKELDKSSPKLMEACASGEHIPTVTFALSKSGDEPLDYLIITMRDVVVTSVSTSGDSDDRPTEEVSLNFGYIQMEYTPQNPDGSLGEKVEFSYNVQTNETQ